MTNEQIAHRNVLSLFVLTEFFFIALAVACPSNGLLEMPVVGHAFELIVSSSPMINAVMRNSPVPEVAASLCAMSWALTPIIASMISSFYAKQCAYFTAHFTRMSSPLLTFVSVLTAGVLITMFMLPDRPPTGFISGAYFKIMTSTRVGIGAGSACLCFFWSYIMVVLITSVRTLVARIHN